MRFIHISDCHFGFDKGETALAQRTNYMKSLLEKVEEIAANKPIDYLFITGDIGWHAEESDYESAFQYMKQLIAACNVEPKHVFICPGNHDVDRNAIADKAYPQNQSDANKWLKVERLERYLAPGFANYEKFCERLQLPKYRIGQHYSYLVGVAQTANLKVIALNSSWYAQSDTVKDNMWIGANFLQVIKQEIQNKSAEEEKGETKTGIPNITVTLIHHPNSKWHEDETCNHLGNTNVFHDLCGISDLILTGHTHEIRCDISYHNNAAITGTGAVYNDCTYNNSFYLYDLTSEYSERVQYYQYANKWTSESSESLGACRLSDKLLTKLPSRTEIINCKTFQDFDIQISAISFKSMDECVKKWYFYKIIDGCPIYRSIKSNKFVLTFIRQFVFFEGREAHIDELFNKCIEKIKNDGIIILKGPQGTGKSTVISMLYITTLNGYRNGELDAYPIYIDIHKYMIKDKLNNMYEFLDDIKKLTVLLDENSNDQKYIVFIDGIDEYESSSSRYEKEICSKIVNKYQDKIVLCVGTIEDVDSNRLVKSQFCHFIEQDSFKIETRAIQVQSDKVDEIIARVASTFGHDLSNLQRRCLNRWILQYSNGTIDYRTILMLYRIITNDEASINNTLAVNLKGYLIKYLSVDPQDFGQLADYAVMYMMGRQLKNNEYASKSQGLILHRDKLIRDFLLSYYFVEHIEHNDSKYSTTSWKEMCQWNVMFPRTVCRFIRDMMSASDKKYLSTLDNTYSVASEEMKSNICFLMGRLNENIDRQKTMLIQYLQSVNVDKSFALYKTIMVSLICLHDSQAETKYIDVLLGSTSYAKEHLKLHCKYYYDNCEYIRSRGKYEYTLPEVLEMVISNTKKSILNEIYEGGLNPVAQSRKNSSLLTDIVTFYTAFLSSGKNCFKKDYLKDARMVCKAVQDSELVPENLKQYAQNVTFAYELQQEPVQL